MYNKHWLHISKLLLSIQKCSKHQHSIETCKTNNFADFSVSKPRISQDLYHLPSAGRLDESLMFSHQLSHFLCLISSFLENFMQTFASRGYCERKILGTQHYPGRQFMGIEKLCGTRIGIGNLQAGVC